MPKVKQFGDCRISIYPRDHSPPHVHVEFRDGDRCTMEIESLRTKGTVRPISKLQQPREWIKAHRRQLLDLWSEIVQ